MIQETEIAKLAQLGEERGAVRRGLLIATRQQLKARGVRP